jgi:hypothetical protein
MPLYHGDSKVIHRLHRWEFLNAANRVAKLQYVDIDHQAVAVTFSARDIGRRGYDRDTKTFWDITDVVAGTPTWVSYQQKNTYGNQECFIIAISDETTAITTGTAKVTFNMPYAFALTKVKASVSTVSTSGNPTFNVKHGGVSVFTTNVSVDVNETFSDTAVTPSVLTSNPLAIASGVLMTIDIVTAGTGAKGAKIYLIGYATGAA